MTVYYATELAPRNTVPVGQVDGSVVNGHVRVHRATITLASQTTSDTIVIGLPNIGDSFLYGVITTDTSLGSSTVAIGITGTTAKYKAAATFTATDTPTLFGKASALTKLTAAETIFISIGAATFPSSGTLVVDLYFSAT
jgi:hypothetical protein